MILCDRCQREILALGYPPDIDVGTRLIRLSDGSSRRIHQKAWDAIGILWPRRDGYLTRVRLAQLLYGQEERADNTVRMAIWYARQELRGSAYEIENIPSLGYRIGYRKTNNMQALRPHVEGQGRRQ